METTHTNKATDQRQSRVGKRPVPLPKGVEMTVQGSTLQLKGPNGALQREIPPQVEVKRQEQELHIIAKPGTGADGVRLQGLVRALLSNMIEGVSKGFATSLDLHGVGYKAELSGAALTMALGLSHQVKIEIPKDVKPRVEIIDEGGQKRPRLHLTSVDKELLGQVAAQLKSFRPPEPYKGKGVRITGERIREKAGKAGAKSGGAKGKK